MDIVEWKRLITSDSAADRSDAADNAPDGNDEEIASYLIAALSDEDALVRTCAADSLGEFHLASSRTALRSALLTEQNETALFYVIISLGKIGEPEDISILIEVHIRNKAKKGINVSTCEAIITLSLRTLLSEISAVAKTTGNNGVQSLSRVAEIVYDSLSFIEDEALAILPIANARVHTDALEDILRRSKRSER